MTTTTTKITAEQEAIAKSKANMLFNRHKHELDGTMDADDILSIFKERRAKDWDGKYPWAKHCVVAMNNLIRDKKERIANGAKAIKSLTKDKTLTNGASVEIVRKKFDGDYSEEGAFITESFQVPCHNPNVCYDDPPDDAYPKMDSKSPFYPQLRRWIAEGNIQRALMVVREWLKDNGWTKEMLEAMDWEAVGANKKFLKKI